MQAYVKMRDVRNTSKNEAGLTNETGSARESDADDDGYYRRYRPDYRVPGQTSGKEDEPSERVPDENAHDSVRASLVVEPRNTEDEYRKIGFER